jgi:hypothetical protein
VVRPVQVAVREQDREQDAGVAGEDGGQVGAAGLGVDRDVRGDGGRVLTAYEIEGLPLDVVGGLTASGRIEATASGEQSTTQCDLGWPRSFRITG